MARSPGRKSLSTGANRRASDHHLFGAAQWHDCRLHRTGHLYGPDQTHQYGHVMVMMRAGNLSRVAASNVRADVSPSGEDASRVREISKRARERGALMIELLVAVALLLGGLLPIAYGIA